MKNCFRDIVWEKVPGKSQKVEGNFFDSDIFCYENGSNENSPDKLVLYENNIDNSSKLVEIDDEEAEKQKEEGAKVIKPSDKKDDSSDFFTEPETDKKDNNHKSGGGGGKYVLPFIGFGGFLICLIGTVLVAKS